MKGIFLTLVVVIAAFAIWKKFGKTQLAASFGFSED